MERLGEKADGTPPVALIPKGVWFVEEFIFVGVQVEIGGEFVALGFWVVDSAGEGLVVGGGVFFFIRLAVAVQVPADSIQLR